MPLSHRRRVRHLLLAGLASHALGADEVGCDQPGIQPLRTQPTRPRTHACRCMLPSPPGIRPAVALTDGAEPIAGIPSSTLARSTYWIHRRSKTQLRSLIFPFCSDALQGRQKANQRLSAVDVEARHTTPRFRGRIVDSRRKKACLPLHRTPPLPIPRFTGSPDLGSLLISS